MPKQF